MATFGILGGGFGLYGYLPAAMELGHDVVTLAKYREKIISRPELRGYQPQLRMVPTTEEVLGSVEALVIARDPTSQARLITENQQRLSQLSHVFLEKPLGPTVAEHANLLKLLLSGEIKFSVAYLFRYSPWFSQTLAQIKNGAGASISWDFVPSQSKWKNDSKLGGGSVGFLFSHFVDMFDHLKIEIRDLVVSSSGSDEVSVSGQAFGASLKVTVRVSKFDRFQIRTAGRSLYRSEGPFGPRIQSSGRDSRVEPLCRYISDRFDSNYLDADRDLEEIVLGFRVLMERQLTRW